MTAGAPHVGQSVPRAEDARYVTGRGEYTADVYLKGALQAVFLRSPHAHATIRHIDVSAALELEGVQMVLTADMVKDELFLPRLFEQPGQESSPRYCLATDKVRYVGEPIAVVVADDEYIGEDALELIRVEYDLLPAVVDTRAAMAPEAPKLWDNWQSNVLARAELAGGDADELTAKSERTVSGTFKMHRHFACSLECRSVAARYQVESDYLTVWISCQGPYKLRGDIAAALHMPFSRVRVLTRDVGGAFGQKFLVYPEDLLIPYLSRMLRRPVRWVEDRREHFLSANHAREMQLDVELHATNDGRLLGLRGNIYDDMGASQEVKKGLFAAVSMCGPYGFEYQDLTVHAVATNKVPDGAYRGVGQPQAQWARESLIDDLADELKVDRARLRLQNFLQPEQFPWQPPVFVPYDSGNYATTFRLGMEAFEYEAWRARQADWRNEGRLIGLGMCCYTEITGFGPSRLLWSLGINTGGYVGTRVKVEREGSVTVFSSMTSQGQGVATMLAQVCADELGVPLADVNVVMGDSSTCPPAGYQTGGSRGAVSGAASLQMATREVIRKASQIAAYRLGIRPYEVIFRDGKFSSGESGASISFREVACEAHDAADLAEGIEPGLEANSVYDPAGLPIAFGAHFAAVELDPSTFQSKIHHYAISHDCGVVINPATVDSQILGALCQSIGGAFTEELIYDKSGQLLTTGLSTYLLPSASSMPEKISLVHTETPSPLNDLGTKGVGEGGCIGAYGALAAAVKDALSPLGYRQNEFPLSSSRIHERVAQFAVGAKN